MGLMDEAMQSDARFSMDTDQFGESITYTRADGTEYTITVVVDRNAPTRDQEYPRPGRVFDVQIAYDVDNTLGLATPPARGDQIAVKDDPSDASLPGNPNKQFIGMVSADSGGWLVQFG